MRRTVAVLVAALLAAVPIANAWCDPAPKQAVIVHFSYGSTNLGPLFALEDKLKAAISAAGVGDYDGNEVAADGSDGVLYMYGRSADKLFSVVKPILESAAILKHVEVTLRYGDASDRNARVAKVRLGS
jgi:hypothetical protein